jgi:hypothetical protein
LEAIPSGTCGIEEKPKKVNEYELQTVRGQNFSLLVPRTKWSAADPGGQGLPLNVLHGNEVDTFGFTNLIDVGNVWVFESRGGLGLPSEASHPAWSEATWAGRIFQGDSTIQPGIAGQIDFSHPARTQKGQNLVGTHLLPCP